MAPKGRASTRIAPWRDELGQRRRARRPRWDRAPDSHPYDGAGARPSAALSVGALHRRVTAAALAPDEDPGSAAAPPARPGRCSRGARAGGARLPVAIAIGFAHG